MKPSDMGRCVRLLSLTGLAVSLIGCAAAPSIDLSVTRLADGPLPLELTSGFIAPTNVVARTQAELEALWDTIYAGRTPRPAPPAVDFNRHLVVARAMGLRPTGGFTVVITGLLREGGQYVVQARETAPGASCAVTLAQTSPVDVALIARHDDPVKFAVSAMTRDCQAGRP
jgi:hypothetical protein